MGRLRELLDELADRRAAELRTTDDEQAREGWQNEGGAEQDAPTA